MNAISKRLLSWLCVIAMVLTLAPVMDLSNFAVETQASSTVGSANLDAITNETEKATATAGVNVDIADTVSDFNATDKTGTCPVCNESVTWDKWSPSSGTTTVANKSIALTKNRHFYFDDSVETIKNIYINTSSGDYSICVWLNKDVTVDTSTACYLGFKTDGTGTGTINFFGEGSITDNSGAFFNLRNKGVLNLYGGTYVYGGAGVAVDSNDGTGTVNIYNGATIGPETQGTTACRNVNVAAGTTFNMYGGTIRNGVSGTANTSGNVHVKDGATFNMYGGTIEGGTYLTSVTNTSRRGGNLYAAGTVNIYGGTIQNGDCYRGGNVAVAGTSTFNMVGGTVKGGHGYEGGNIWSAGEPQIGGNALIADGDATTYGGNIYVYGKTVTTSGTIAGGTATTAGGNIYVKSGTSLAVTGGTIVGDVVAATGATAVNLSNAPKIVTNETINQKEYTADAGIQMSADSTLVDISGLTAGAQIAFTADVGTTLTKAHTGVQTMMNNGYFSMTDSLKDIKVENDVLVVIEKVFTAPQPVNPGDTAWPDDAYQIAHKGNNIAQTVSDFDATNKTGTCPVCNESVTWEVWSGTTLGSKNFDLKKDRHFYFDGTVETIKNITIRDNPGGYSVCVWLQSQDNLTVAETNYIGFNNDDENEYTGGGTMNFFGEGTITDENGGGFLNLNDSGVLNLYGGTYVYKNTDGDTDNSAIGFKDGTGTVNIYNGATIGPETMDTNAVYMNVVVGADATVNMYGGTIRNGVSSVRTKSGNVHVPNGGTFNMYGGTISGGGNIADTTSTKGGGNLYVAGGGKVNIYGGTITGGGANENADIDNGGNIFLAGSTNSVFNMTGGKVLSGKASSGGNIYSGANITIGQYALIEGGTASGSGGNIYINTNSVTTSGTIRGGKAVNRGGNIYVKADTTLTVDGGVIAGGQADSNTDGTGWGGNIGAIDSEVVINDGTIYGGYGSDVAVNDNVAVRTEKKVATTAVEAPKLTINGGTIVGNIGLSATETKTDADENEYTVTGTQVAISGDAQIVTSMTIGNEDVTADYGIYIGEGNEIDVTNLTTDASIEVSPRKAGIALTKGPDATGVYDCFTVTDASMYKQNVEGVIFAYSYAVYIMKADGQKVGYADNTSALNAYVHGTDKYVVLDGDATLNGAVVINTKGENLNLSGSGEVTLIDTENKDFSASGKVTVTSGSITFVKDATVDGSRYITIKEDNEAYSAHYVKMTVTNVALRTDDPEVDDDGVGLYYKVSYQCDNTLKDRVRAYGVALSTHYMPKANFYGDQNVMYTWLEDFDSVWNENKASTYSCLLENILSPDYDEDKNRTYADMRVYANPYLAVDFDGTDDVTYHIGDLNNAGNAYTEGYTGVAYSLNSVLDKINDNWDMYKDSTVLASFWTTWGEYLNTALATRFS